MTLNPSQTFSQFQEKICIAQCVVHVLRTFILIFLYAKWTPGNHQSKTPKIEEIFINLIHKKTGAKLNYVGKTSLITATIRSFMLFFRTKIVNAKKASSCLLERIQRDIMRSSINHVDIGRGRVLVKCPIYYISLIR